ncbi:hypothetical protein DPSP01_004476 [Paraphaeosphaeria sporulosa]
MHLSQSPATPPHTVLTCLHSASGGSLLSCIFSWFRRAASCSALVFGVGSISPRCSLFFLLSLHFGAFTLDDTPCQVHNFFVSKETDLILSIRSSSVKKRTVKKS